MAQMSDYLENALINAVLRNTAYVSPATVYVALFTSDPTDAGTGTEVAGGAYARQAVPFGAPANGQSTNIADLNFPIASADWGVVTHAGVFDASEGGNMLFHAPATYAKQITTGDQYVIKSGQLTVTLA